MTQPSHRPADGDTLSHTQVDPEPADGRRLFITAKLIAVGRMATVIRMNSSGMTGPLASVSMKPMFR